MLCGAEEEVRNDGLPPRSGRVLEAVLYRGALPRGDVAGLLDLSERQARRITSALLSQGVVESPSSRARSQAAPYTPRGASC